MSATTRHDNDENVPRCASPSGGNSINAGKDAFTTPNAPTMIDSLRLLLEEAEVPENQRDTIATKLYDSGFSPRMIRSGEAKDFLVNIVGGASAIRLNRLSQKAPHAPTATLPPTGTATTLVTDCDKSRIVNPEVICPLTKNTNEDDSTALLPIQGQSEISLPTQRLFQDPSFSELAAASSALNTTTSLPRASTVPVIAEDNTGVAASPPEEDPRFTSLFEFLDQTAANKVAVSTQDSALAFRYRYDKTYKKIDAPRFDESDPDTIACTTMNYLKEQEQGPLCANTKFSVLTHLIRAIKFFKKKDNVTLSTSASTAITTMKSMYWNQAQQDRLTNDQNAYRAITKKDLLHLINSAIQEQQGKPLIYHQIHAITSVCLVQATSRRFFEFMCITIPEMTLEFITNGEGKQVRCLTFSTAYDKLLRYTVSRQSISEGKSVEKCAILWVLMMLQSLGVIPSALEAWDSGVCRGTRNR